MAYYEEHDKRSDVRYSKDQEKDLIRKAQKGDNTSLDKIFEANKGFILYMAKKISYNGLDDDMISDANLGFLEAVKRYDLSYDVSIRTYAEHWIKKEIIRGLKERNTISVPSDQRRIYKRINQEIKEYETKNGKDLDLNTICLKLNQKYGYSYNPKDIELLLRQQRLSRVSSYDKNPYQDSDVSLKDLLFEDLDKSHEDQAYENELSEIIQQHLELFEPKERLIIEQYFSGNLHPRQIADMHDLSKTRLNIIISRSKRILFSNLSNDPRLDDYIINIQQ